MDLREEVIYCNCVSISLTVDTHLCLSAEQSTRISIESEFGGFTSSLIAPESTDSHATTEFCKQHGWQGASEDGLRCKAAVRRYLFTVGTGLKPCMWLPRMGSDNEV